MVRMCRNKAIFDGMSTKDDIVDDLPVDYEDNIEGEVSEATVMEIEDLRNKCVRETEDDLNRRLLQNHKEFIKGCSRKKKIPVWAFYLPFWRVACDDGAIWYYCTFCHCVEPITQQETMKGVVKYKKKHLKITEPYPSCACKQVQQFPGIP